MPVYRDAVGGVGTPTSDNERTKISEGTTHLLAIMNGYSGSEGLEENVTYMVDLLKEFAEAQEVKLYISNDETKNTRRFIAFGMDRVYVIDVCVRSDCTILFR